MKFVNTSVYRGPNVYALFPVIRHTVDLGVLEDWPTARLGNGFIDGLIDALPGLSEHGCSYRVLWNAFKRLAAGASESEKRAMFHDTAARVYRLDI